jgi:hypothetical protein
MIKIVHFWRNIMTKRYYQNSLKFKVLERINTFPGNVVLRKEIADMGSPRQISRCLETLIEMGELVKIGYGVYAKSYRSKFINESIIKSGFDRACIEALTKLGIKWELGSAAQAYNAGLSTQVPVRLAVQLKSRFRRQLNYNNRKLLVENGINAR